MKRFFCLLLCVLSLLSFCACTPIAEEHVEQPSLSVTEIKTTAFTKQTVTLNDAKDVTWTTDGQSITLTPIENTCEIVGTAAETATVTATYKDVSYTVKVVITDGFTFDKDAIACTKTDAPFTAEGRRTDTLRFLKYESSDPMVVGVDENGTLTPHRAGTATVRAYTVKEGDLDELTVTVYESEIMLSAYHVLLSCGQSVELKAEKNCTWTSADESVATVQNGVVTAVSDGKTTVTATAGDLTETCEVVVGTQAEQTVPYDDGLIAKIGRGYFADDAYVFSNCASGFTVAFYGTGLSADLVAAAQTRTPSAPLSVVVDGEFTALSEITVTDKQTYTLAEGLTNGYHTVTVFKTDEAYASDCALFSLTCKGIFTPAPESPALKIEIYGDSISAGLSNMKKTGADDNCPQNSLYAYGPILSRMLCADVSVHACSGINLCTDKGMSVLYQYTGCNNTSYYSKKAVAWNTDNYTPDVVIIHLGTNDFSKKWYDQTEFVHQYKIFINTLRELYGEDTVFLLCEGSMTNQVARQVVEAAKDQKNTYVVSLLQVTKGHPSADEQAVIAKTLYKKILSLQNQ